MAPEPPPPGATARLIDVAVPDRPAGVVLVLHGGGHRGTPVPVSPTQLSVLRMIPIAQRVARAAAGRLAVARLIDTWRGWEASRTPLEDVDWALAESAAQFGPDVPVALLGHSLGGRAALLSAGDPRVRGVVALNPWVYGDDVPAGPDLAGTPVAIIHGDADRVASPERSRSVADRLERLGAPVSYTVVPGGKHAMLSHRNAFDGAAADAVVAMLT